MCCGHAGHDDGTDEIVGPYDLGIGIEGPWVAPIFTAGADDSPHYSNLPCRHTRHCLLASPHILTQTRSSSAAMVRARLAPTHSHTAPDLCLPMAADSTTAVPLSIGEWKPYPPPTHTDTLQATMWWHRRVLILPLLRSHPVHHCVHDLLRQDRAELARPVPGADAASQNYCAVCIQHRCGGGVPRPSPRRRNARTRTPNTCPAVCCITLMLLSCAYPKHLPSCLLHHPHAPKMRIPQTPAQLCVVSPSRS